LDRPEDPTFAVTTPAELISPQWIVILPVSAATLVDVVSRELAQVIDRDSATWRPLPEAVAELLVTLAAPARLAAHLRVVHDVACQLTDRLAARHPALVFDADAVRFGAASHDIGKVRYPDELVVPGSKHETAGPVLLVAHGVPARLARFAGTHASWTAPETTLDDHLVSLADKIWKAQRRADLEDLVTAELAVAGQVERWQAFTDLDDILDELAADADARLAYQAQYPVHAP
jgi:hypothetical protein